MATDVGYLSKSMSITMTTENEREEKVKQGQKSPESDLR